MSYPINSFFFKLSDIAAKPEEDKPKKKKKKKPSTSNIEVLYNLNGYFVLFQYIYNLRTLFTFFFSESRYKV